MSYLVKEGGGRGRGGTEYSWFSGTNSFFSPNFSVGSGYLHRGYIPVCSHTQAD